LRAAAIIYPIIDTTVCSARGIDPFALTEACLRGGATLLQIRAKDDSSAALLALIDRVVAAARPYGARVIVNDRADLARMADAGGVHVGQTDIPVASAMSIVGPGKIVGLSTHDRAQVDAALAGPASYVAVGPIFSTATKATGYDPRGLDLVSYAAGRGKPIVAIGGITLETAPDVIGAGAYAVAVITDILVQGDPEARVRAYAGRLPPQPFNV
jgi:thiamine-phosphate pyrophosphorylase